MRHRIEGDTRADRGNRATEEALKPDATPKVKAKALELARKEYALHARALRFPVVQAVMRVIDNDEKLKEKGHCLFALDEADMLLAQLVLKFGDSVLVTSDLDMLLRVVPS